MDPYGDGNEVKINNTTADYYRLETPKDVDNIFKANIGVGYGVTDALTVEAGVEQSISATDETKYRLGLSWEF